MTIPGIGAIGDVLGGLFGEGGIGQQFLFWGFLGSILDNATQPFQQLVRQHVLAQTPVVPLSPADLADMVTRNILTPEQAAPVATLSGISNADFALLCEDVGEPPAIEQMLQLYRRSIVDQPTMERAIRQSRVRDEWVPLVLQMGMDLPTPIDVLTAYLKGQIDTGTAHELYAKLGGAPEYFDMLYNTRGEGPSPNEAASMARRGVIPWTGIGADVTSYEQAVHEGAFRNKWAAAFKALAEYIPPPRTISTLYSEGAITQEQALTLFSQAGLSPELAAAYLHAASGAKIATHKQLAVSTIDKLIQLRAITDDQAITLLGLLGYSPDEAQFILLINQMARHEKFLTAAVNATHSEYVSHKVSRTEASATLDALQLAATERDDLLALWDIERGVRPSLLTAAQIKKAYTDGIWTQDVAVAKLVNRGYAADDAAIYLQE